jgi:hypothetical protein
MIERGKRRDGPGLLRRTAVFLLSADISGAGGVMENISTVVLIMLVASVVVAAVACSGHGRWY